MITRSGTRLMVEDEQGTGRWCHPRRRAGRAVCGDRVHWEWPEGGGCVLTSVQPRRNEVTRRNRHRRLRTSAANVDQLVVVIAPRPAPQWGLIDRYLVAGAALDAQVLLLLNKLDLIGPGDHVVEDLAIYARAGYATLTTSAATGEGMDALANALRDRTNILVGQSGMGKSALARYFLPHQDIAIGGLSVQGSAGRHTTTQATLYHLPPGGDLIDSPGVRHFDPPRLTSVEIQKGFLEFRPHAGRCRFHNCTHMNEPGCAVIGAAEGREIHSRRLASYQRLFRSLQGEPSGQTYPLDPDQ